MYTPKPMPMPKSMPMHMPKSMPKSKPMHTPMLEPMHMPMLELMSILTLCEQDRMKQLLSRGSLGHSTQDSQDTPIPTPNPNPDPNQEPGLALPYP